MKNIGFSFDDLPMAVSQLTDKVNSIYSMLARHSMPQESPQTEDKLLSVREASTLLRLTVPTIYSKVSRGELPCMTDKAKDVLGWKPQYADLETIVSSAWAWHKSHPHGFAD